MFLSLQIAMMHANRAGYKVDFEAPPYPDSLISRARQNELVRFLQGKYDLLFSMDDDIVIQENGITKLAENHHHLGIVAGVYRLKGVQPHIAVRLPPDNPGWSKILGKPLVTPAVYVSTGCMMVSRDVVLGMIAKYPRLTYNRIEPDDTGFALYMPFIHNNEYLSEDWAFCQRALDADFKVWVNGGVKCGHWGKELFGFDES